MQKLASAPVASYVSDLQDRLTARHAVFAERVQIPLRRDADAHEPDHCELIDVLDRLAALPADLANPPAENVGSCRKECRPSKIGLAKPIKVRDERDERRLAD